MIKRLKVYADTSVIISLADPSDIFHNQSTGFIDNLVENKVECCVSSPLIVELGRIVEVKGTKRCLDIINTAEDFNIHFESIDMKKVWNLSQIYLQKRVLTMRHRLDLLHYAAATLLNCTYLASWNGRQFNDKTAIKVNMVNSGRVIKLNSRKTRLYHQASKSWLRNMEMARKCCARYAKSYLWNWRR